MGLGLIFILISILEFVIRVLSINIGNAYRSLAPGPIDNVQEVPRHRDVKLVMKNAPGNLAKPGGIVAVHMLSDDLDQEG